MSKYQVTVVMPALNEEHNIESAIKDVQHAFSKLSINGEVIVVDDGSTDKTAYLVNKLREFDKNIDIVSHPKNKGFGAAFWTGVKKSSGDVILCMPGDGENDCSEILRYLDLMKHVDIVVPYIFNTLNRSLPRRILSKTYKGIINLSFGMLLNYMNGNVMYRRSVLECVELKSFGFFFQTELLIKSIRKGFLYAEVPCAMKERQSGDSKAVSFSSLFRVISGYAQTFIAVFLLDRLQKKSIPKHSATQKRMQLIEKKVS